MYKILVSYIQNLLLYRKSDCELRSYEGRTPVRRLVFCFTFSDLLNEISTNNDSLSLVDRSTNLIITNLIQWQKWFFKAKYRSSSIERNSFPEINEQNNKQIEYVKNKYIIQFKATIDRIQRVHFHFYELNNDNQVVKTIRMLMMQIINIKSDDLKISLRMKFSVA